MLGINRNSAANYLHLLQMQGRVTVNHVGPAKIYSLSDKLPVDAVLKLSDNGVIIFSKGETVVECNKQFRELLQLSKKDVIGKSAAQLPFLVDLHPELPRFIRNGLKGKENRISVDLVLNDRSIPCTITISPVFFESGDPGVALIADIPAGTGCPPRNDNDPDHSFTGIDGTEYICRFTPDGTLTYVNRAYCNLLQKSTAELIGHTWRPRLPENEYTKIKQCLISLDSYRPVASVEFKSITPGGDPRWQRWIFRNLFDQNGQSTCYMGTGTDITAVKNLEEKVRKGAQETGSLVRKHKAEIQDLHQQIYKEIASHERTHFQLQFTQFAMDNISYLIMWVSHEGRFVYINKEAGEVLGYPDHELQAKKFLDIFTSGFSFRWDDIWEAIQRDQRYTLETTLMTRKGKEIPVEMVLNYLEFKEKLYCCCFAKDITERKRSEEVLRESEEKYRQLVDLAQEGIWAIDADGKTSYVNPRMAEILGYTVDEMQGAHLFSFMDEAGKVIAAKDLERRRQGIKEDHEFEFITKGGTRVYATLSTTPITDEGGAYKGALAVVSDVTERKRLDDALRESEETFKALAENANDGILVALTDGAHTYANRRAAEITGYRVAELLKTSIKDLAAPDELEKVTERFRTILQGGPVPPQYQTTLINKERNRVPIEVTSAKTIWHGQPADLVIIRDITERKRAEEALHASALYTRSLIEASLDPLVTISPEGKIKDVNVATERVTGYSRDNLIGTDFSDYFTDPKKAGEGYRKVFEEGVVWDYPLEIRHRDGTITSVLYNATIYRDESGTVQGVFAAARNITEREAGGRAVTEIRAKGHGLRCWCRRRR